MPVNPDADIWRIRFGKSCLDEQDLLLSADLMFLVPLSSTVGLVYSAEYLNELAAMNWRSFSDFQYFDSKGMFISLVFSIPLLLNAVIIVMVWVYRTFSTMTELKTLQLKRKARREKND